MLIEFNTCDGRHVAADEENALLYRIYIWESVCMRSTTLRHRRHHSLVFVVIIADECRKEKGEPGKVMQKTEGENKLNEKNRETLVIKRSDLNQRYILVKTRQRGIYEEMKNTERNSITKKK
ncbi:hypothetical protein I4U23_028081 [Adineta vaga]|nr:hypothetical protein I4U23_028081 [Adineta vaga]